MLARMPSGTAIATDCSTTCGVIAHEDQRGVVAPLEEAVEDALRRQREQHAEDGAGHGDERAFGEHLQQDPPPREADQPQDADGAAPLVHQHHHQREQEHRAADDGHDGDREVEALEHDERARCARRAPGRARDRARHARGDVAGERRRLAGLLQRDVDRRHRSRAIRDRADPPSAPTRSGRCSRASSRGCAKRSGSGAGS